MNIREDIKKIIPEIKNYRHYLHQNPEIAFNENNTSKFIADLLKEWGYDIDVGWAKTGIVTTIPNNKNRTIGLRADIDALPIKELNDDLAYKSQNDGKMHACGHDGHTAMLLGAAKYLRNVNFDNINICFIFQPAEENGGGANVMIKEGFMEKYNLDRIYGMHNWPGLKVGNFGALYGPVMAAAYEFEINIKGKGGHAAMPYENTDQVLIASQIIGIVHNWISRSFHPCDPVVISISCINGGDIFNVLPETVNLKGTLRAFKEESVKLAREKIEATVDSICKLHNIDGKVLWKDGYPATINEKFATDLAKQAASKVSDNVSSDFLPSMGGEDFAFFLQKIPGHYILIGNGDTAKLHNPRYNFNDDILPIGIEYWVSICEVEENV